MKTVIVVAKGPSAEHAESWINGTAQCDIAAINDAGRLLPNYEMDYAFVTDTVLLRKMLPLESRIKTFVATKRSFEFQVPLRVARKMVRYEDDECGATLEEYTQRIIAGGICHHHTTTGALHWLVKHGRYEKVKIIGVDGGISYAQGVCVTGQIIKDLDRDPTFLDQWKNHTIRLCKILTRVYGTEFEWYGEPHV